MKPGGPWLIELNKQRPPTAGYFAISWNYEPPEWAARDRVTDLVFKNTSNDLIVPEKGVHAPNGATSFPIGNTLSLTAMQSVQNDADPRTSGLGLAVTVHPWRARHPRTWREPRLAFVVRCLTCSTLG